MQTQFDGQYLDAGNDLLFDFTAAYIVDGVRVKWHAEVIRLGADRRDVVSGTLTFIDGEVEPGAADAVAEQVGMAIELLGREGLPRDVYRDLLAPAGAFEPAG
jgi:hypothetical protein